MVEGAAKLITAIGSLVGAIAWPLVFAGTLLAFRKEIKSSFSRFPAFLDRLRKMKVAGVEAELDALADKAPSGGEVTAEQTEAAAHIAVESRNLGNDYLFSELDKLCIQYDTVRRTMPPSSLRTREMTRIVVKMRALGPSTSDRIDAYKGSGSAGSRLAAVAMMQMEPAYVDLDWLLERFRTDAPFIFYHASLALTNAANFRTGTDRQGVIVIAQAALDLVESFKGGPDQGTVEALRAVLSS